MFICKKRFTFTVTLEQYILLNIIEKFNNSTIQYILDNTKS